MLYINSVFISNTFKVALPEFRICVSLLKKNITTKKEHFFDNLNEWSIIKAGSFQQNGKIGVLEGLKTKIFFAPQPVVFLLTYYRYCKIKFLTKKPVKILKSMSSLMPVLRH